MANRPDLPRLYKHQRPSMFNREALGWALGISLLAGIAVPMLAPAVVGLFTTHALTAGTMYVVGLVGSAVGYAAGFIYGGQKGIVRQQREMVGGQTVKDPTFLNSGMWNGLSVLQGVGIASTAALLLTHATTAAHLALVAAAPVMAPALALPLTVMAIGSIVRKGQMKRDFNHSVALAQQATPGMVPAQDVGQALEPTPGIYKGTVSAQEAALLEAKQSSSSLADKVSASRAQLAETQR